jgi:hypothetical protein
MPCISWRTVVTGEVSFGICPENEEMADVLHQVFAKLDPLELFIDIYDEDANKYRAYRLGIKTQTMNKFKIIAM